jgi:hypothetical protein
MSSPSVDHVDRRCDAGRNPERHVGWFGRHVELMSSETLPSCGGLVVHGAHQPMPLHDPQLHYPGNSNTPLPASCLPNHS